MKKTFLIAVAALASTFAVHADGTNAAPVVKPDLLKTCPVSGEKLGEMGKPTIIVYKGQEVKFCCPDCKKEFDKDRAQYLKKIRAADINSK
jgi:YHS domain-containing protein